MKSILLLGVLCIPAWFLPVQAQPYEDCIPAARLVREPFRWPLNKVGIDSVTYVPLKVSGHSIVLEHYIMFFDQAGQNVQFLSYLIKMGEVSNVSRHGEFQEVRDRHATYKLCGEFCLIYLRYHFGGAGPVNGTPLPLHPRFPRDDDQ